MINIFVFVNVFLRSWTILTVFVIVAKVTLFRVLGVLIVVFGGVSGRPRPRTATAWRGRCWSIRYRSSVALTGSSATTISI